jgi:hypothetical protein
VQQARRDEQTEQNGGGDPDAEREQVQPCVPARQERRCGRHDPGAHRGREPVRTDVAEDLGPPSQEIRNVTGSLSREDGVLCGCEFHGCTMQAARNVSQ